ncbi:MAG TPA: serine/threonine-protein kinase, partial [Pirellulaceae bacterium]
MMDPQHRPRDAPGEQGATRAHGSVADHTLAVTPPDAVPVPRIPGYEIECELGRGGMGVVYLARDIKLHRQVAIKTVSVAGRAPPKILERFRTESQAVAGLQHPNIGQVFVADEYDGQPYFVMEFIAGPNLGDQTRNRPQEAKSAAELVAILADAIQYCHERHILHRDLKPNNVLMVDSRTPKIVDFGLAKSLTSDSSATRTGEILGTPGYMAPEQASGVVKTLGPECDVYGLGAILYRLLTGRPPFDAPEPLQTVIMVLTDDAIPPRQLQRQIPRDLETICLKCLAKSPARRYRSAAELASDLRRFVAGKPIVARPVGFLERVMKFARRRPSLAALGASLLLMITASVLGLTWHNRKLGASLARSQRLVDHGSELSMWV